MATTNGSITVAFPVHKTLNPDGQFDKLERNGDKWALLNTTTGQRKELSEYTKGKALQAVVEPLMA